MKHKVKWWRWCCPDLAQHRTAFSLLLFFSLFPALLAVHTQDSEISMPHQEVEYWANKMGNHIFHLSNSFAQYKDIKDNFVNGDAKIRENDGLQLVKEMAVDVTNMMKFKVDAVKRIMNVAEEASLDEENRRDEEVDYHNAKRLNKYDMKAINDQQVPILKPGYTKLELVENSHFDGHPVNDNVSSVHVPTNVYDKASEIMNAIRWSGRLDRTFRSNYELDPTLSWQYFGSSTGFLRQYPASEWVMDENDPDLYDARLRSWYIEAANSPKDMVILLDESGSMKGLKKEIAKHVVLNILETLNENDFVNVFTFSKETHALVPCFNDTLVQANLENLGHFKEELKTGDPKEVANFTQALTKAFELLQRYNKSGLGSQCNQAIMMVTDGAPYNFEEIFEKYNWPHLQVRMFTYLIGQEEKKVRYLNWMACANKGYFVHVTTLAEVREQVLKYIPVMARPMVMYQSSHPHKWTGVYADIAGRRDAPGTTEGYRLMTSVSVPVFDRKKTTVKTANLLGVAGTDVPIREIEKLVPPYKLGVNGYSFMVNRNGYILYHPDLRPVHREVNAEFQDILKPNYNSVDFAEVELTDDDSEPRNNNTDLLELRRDLIEHRGVEATLKVKIHMDDMKRVVQREQRYFTQGISGTPFSLGIAMPEGYGRYKVHGQIELSLEMSDPRSNKAMDHFSTGNWTLHPDWVYCEYKYNQHQMNKTPEDLMTDFLSRAQKPLWKWRSTRTRPPPEPTMAQSQYVNYKQATVDNDKRDNYYCDKDLVQSLLFDARATNVYSDTMSVEERIQDKDSAHQRFGITTAFVATRSGLTRWMDFTKIDPAAAPSTHEPNTDLPHFMKVHNKAIDEVWYKRAVDYYDEDPEAYVYSVPFDAATRDPEEVLVTATRAIFIEENRHRRAPAAVVGVTIKHKEFVTYFKNETYKCPSYPSNTNNCKVTITCESTSLDCYLLDDNGFIVVSEKEADTGKFFGLLEGTIMESLVQSEVYKKVRMFDYQAVCLDSKMENNPASIMSTPIQMVKLAANWMMGNIFWMLVKTHLYTLWDPNLAWAYTHNPEDAEYPNLGNIPHQDNFEYKDVGTDDQLSPGGWPPMYLSDEGVEEAETLAEDVPAENYYDNNEESSGKGPIEEGSRGEGSEEEGSSQEGLGKPYSGEMVDYEVLISEAQELEVEAENSETEEAVTDDQIMKEYYDDLNNLNYDINGVPPDDGGMQYPHDFDNSEPDGDFPSLELAYINTTHPRPCDKEVYLYKLQNHKLMQDDVYKPVKGKLSNCHTNGCGRPFSVQKVRSTNLILVAVNNLCPCEARKVSIELAEVEYDEEKKCKRLLLQHFRKRPPICVNYHPDEHNIELCGGAGSLSLPSATLLSLLLLVHAYTTLQLRS